MREGEDEVDGSVNQSSIYGSTYKGRGGRVRRGESEG